MPSTTPTKAQKEWREAVRSLGSIISGGPAVIHHPVGRTGRHQKIDIGHWWVIPLTDEEHKALHNGDLNWGGLSSRKAIEKVAFAIVCEELGRPFGDDIYRVIMDYHK